MTVVLRWLHLRSSQPSVLWSGFYSQNRKQYFENNESTRDRSGTWESMPLGKPSEGSHWQPSAGQAVRPTAPSLAALTAHSSLPQTRPHLICHSGRQASQLLPRGPDSVIALRCLGELNSMCAVSNSASRNTSARPTVGRGSGFTADESHSRGTSQSAFFGFCIQRLSLTTADKHIILFLQIGAFFPLIFIFPPQGWLMPWDLMKNNGSKMESICVISGKTRGQ